VLAALTLLSACSETSDDGGSEKPSTNLASAGGEAHEPTAEELSVAGPKQIAAIEDNAITETEYRSGFERFRACLSGEGYELTSIRDAGAIVEYGVPVEAVDAGADQPCYEREFRLVDIMWQLDHADELLNATNLRIVNTCLLRNGIDAESEIDKAVESMQNASLSEDECGLLPGQLEGKAPS